jgi:nucleoside-diphosphate-sugar epimerase
MDVSKLHELGFYSSIDLEEGIRSVYEDYKQKNPSQEQGS